jgi:hypothetical protein
MVLPLVAALVGSLLFGAGCATDASRARGIDSLHVFSAPMALDLDGTAGPDSFGLTLYASTADIPKGLPIAAGRIEIQMFDGPLLAEGNAQAAPMRVWTFTEADLKNRGVKTSLGTGYRFTLRWNETVPRRDRITLVVRYLPPRGIAIQSAPTTVALSTEPGVK